MGKRTKYDYDFRLRCVESVLAGHDSVSSIAKENGIKRSNLQLWLKFYETYGEPGLKSMVNRHYDAHFKLTVLRTIDQEKLSLMEACVRFNISSVSVIVS